MRRKAQPLTPEAELCCIQRAAKVTAALVRGEGLTTRNVMAMTGLSRQGAEYMLTIIGGVLRLYHDKTTGVWELQVFGELE